MQEVYFYILFNKSKIDEGVDSYHDFQQGIEMNTKIRNSNNNNDFNPDHPF